MNLLKLILVKWINRNESKFDVNKIQCGAYYTIIQMKNGICFSFGSNYYGQLGIGNKQKQLKPVELISPSNEKNNQFVHIFCGCYHNFGITNNGECYGWGTNYNGKIGLLSNNNNDNCLTLPIRLKEAPLSKSNNQFQRYIWFSCGFSHTIALTNLGISFYLFYIWIFSSTNNKYSKKTNIW